jgi:cyclic lactone autoinducer peptide
MSALVARIADKAITSVAKRLANTGCWWGCHRIEAPEELL